MISALKYPLHIEIKLTNRCNLKCTHCIASAGLLNKSELSTKEIFSIIDDAKKNGAFTLGLTGGEPLLHQDLQKIIDKVHKSGLQLIFTSNGTLIEKSFLEKNKKKISLFRISIDHYNAEDHDKFRGVKGCFDKTLDTIKLLLEYKNYFQITTLTVVSKHNFNGLTQMINFLEDIGVYSANIFLFVPGGRGKKRKNKNAYSLTHKDIKEFCNLICSQKKIRKNISIHTSNPLMSIVEPDNHHSRCPAAFSSIFITENGHVLPCPYFYSNSYPEDNIRNNNIIDIWHKSERFASLRKQQNLDKKCISCKYVNSCFGGCRAGAFMEYGTIKKADPMCWLND